MSTEGKPNSAGLIGYKQESTALKQADGINIVDKYARRMKPDSI